MSYNRFVPLYTTQSGAIPHTSSLEVGELATNLSDGTLFTKTHNDVILQLTPTFNVTRTRELNLLSRYYFDTSSQVVGQPYGIQAVNDKWYSVPTLLFGTSSAQQPTVQHGIQGITKIPSTYISSPVVEITWTANATAGNVIWGIDYRIVSGNNLESLDQSGVTETVFVTASAPSVAHNQLITTISLTGTNIKAGSRMLYYIYRHGGEPADTMADYASVFHIAMTFLGS